MLSGVSERRGWDLVSGYLTPGHALNRRVTGSGPRVETCTRPSLPLSLSLLIGNQGCWALSRRLFL